MKHARSIDALVNSGELIDVSHLARGVGVPCPAFITRTFWECPEIARSEQAATTPFSKHCDLRELVAKGGTGQIRGIVTDDCLRWPTGFHALVERFDGKNLAIVVSDMDEVLDVAAEGIAAGDARLT